MKKSLVSLLFLAVAYAQAAYLPNAIPQGSTTAGQVGPMVQGASTASAPSYTGGQVNPLSLDTSGNLRVVLPGTQPISGTVTAGTVDVTATGTITVQNSNPNSGAATASSTVSLSGLNGITTIGIQVTGTYTGALTPQVTIDGTNWIAASSVVNFTTGAQSATIASASVGVFTIDVSGVQAFRVSANAAVTGTATVTLRGSTAVTMVTIDAPLPTGTNSIGNIGQISTSITPGAAAANLGKAEDAASASGDTGVFVLGVRRDAAVISASATGDYQEPALSKYGAVLTSPLGYTGKTYRGVANVAAAASATDIAILPGNASNTVYVTKVIVSGIETTAGLVDVSLVKRSTANSAGTSTAITAVPLDSSDAAATSLPLQYTANPTPGTAVGTVDRAYINAAPLASGTIPTAYTFDFGKFGKPVVLSGVAQGLAVNLNGATVTGGTFTIVYEWIELP